MSRPSLSGLSDRELLGRLKSLVERERATTLEILVHLNEVERRRLYLSQGFPSLFEYCTRHLGYSSSAAGRRIAAARCVRDYPEVLGLLENNEVQLSSVCLVAPILTRENKDDLLARIRNKSQKEIEGIVADYRPPVAFRDRARPVCVAVPQGPARTPAVLLAENTSHFRCGSSAAAGLATGGLPGVCNETGALLQPSTPPRVARPKPQGPRFERKLLVQFLASEAFMEKFERARALLSSRLDERTFERVFEVMIDEFLERHSPERRNARREKRRTKHHGDVKPAKKVKTPGESRPEPAKAPVDTARKTGRGARRIPAAVRDRVFARDKGRCTYVARTGERCNATHGLQIDHIVPYARGGNNTADNLRLLCAKHNRLEAERVYGANAIRRYRPRE